MICMVLMKISVILVEFWSITGSKLTKTGSEKIKKCNSRSRSYLALPGPPWMHHTSWITLLSSVLVPLACRKSSSTFGYRLHNIYYAIAGLHNYAKAGLHMQCICKSLGCILCNSSGLHMQQFVLHMQYRWVAYAIWMGCNDGTISFLRFQRA